MIRISQVIILVVVALFLALVVGAIALNYFASPGNPRPLEAVVFGLMAFVIVLILGLMMLAQDDQDSRF